MFGPPGTGKTDLAKRLLHELGTRIIGIAILWKQWHLMDGGDMRNWREFANAK